jgi:hypothetical protein
VSDECKNKMLRFNETQIFDMEKCNKLSDQQNMTLLWIFEGIKKWMQNNRYIDLQFFFFRRSTIWMKNCWVVEKMVMCTKKILKWHIFWRKFHTSRANCEMILKQWFVLRIVTHRHLIFYLLKHIHKSVHRGIEFF